MAKKQDTPKVNAGLFARTDAPTSNTTERNEPGRTVAMSVALQNAELDILQDIADKSLVKRGNVMSFAVRLFLREYKAGRVKLKRGARNVLELPEGYELPAEPLDR